MKTIKSKLELVDIMGEGFHYIAEVKINGKKGMLIVDSGASRSVFDKERFKTFKAKTKQTLSPMQSAGAGGTISDMQITIVKNITFFQKLNIKNYLIALADLSHINNVLTTFKKQPIDGVIGSDILKTYGAIVDFAKCTITLNFDEKKINKANADYIKAVRKNINV